MICTIPCNTIEPLQNMLHIVLSASCTFMCTIIHVFNDHIFLTLNSPTRYFTQISSMGFSPINFLAITHSTKTNFDAGTKDAANFFFKC